MNDTLDSVIKVLTIVFLIVIIVVIAVTWYNWINDPISFFPDPTAPSESQLTDLINKGNDMIKELFGG